MSVAENEHDEPLRQPRGIPESGALQVGFLALHGPATGYLP